MRFRKKPVEIEAQQFDGSNESAAAILYWIGGSERALAAAEAGERLAYVNGAGALFIRTLESGDGHHLASPGDWIVKGIHGEFYPVKPDIFVGSYDAVPLGGLPPEPMVPIGVVKGLELELAQARKKWMAEVKALRTGRRERIAGRVLAALVGTMGEYLDDEDETPEDRLKMQREFATFALGAADALIEALDGPTPPCQSVRTA